MSFNKTFTKLCYSREPSIVFEDFLDFVIDQFLINPGLKYFNYKEKNNPHLTYYIEKNTLIQEICLDCPYFEEVEVNE